jgi:hypothetical protein
MKKVNVFSIFFYIFLYFFQTNKTHKPFLSQAWLSATCGSVDHQLILLKTKLHTREFFQLNHLLYLINHHNKHL